MQGICVVQAEKVIKMFLRNILACKISKREPDFSMYPDQLFFTRDVQGQNVPRQPVSLRMMTC